MLNYGTEVCNYAIINMRIVGIPLGLQQNVLNVFLI